MNFAQETERAKALILKKLADVNKPGVFVAIRWSARYIAKMGSAQLTSRERQEGRITLSKALWPEASPEQRDETIVHELAHILDALTKTPKPIRLTTDFRVKRKRRVFHGPSWKAWMARLGYPRASVTHDVGAQAAHARRRAKRSATRGGNGWSVSCNRCASSVRMGPLQFKKARRGTHAYTHKGCGGVLLLGSAREFLLDS